MERTKHGRAGGGMLKIVIMQDGIKDCAERLVSIVEVYWESEATFFATVGWGIKKHRDIYHRCNDTTVFHN